MEVESIKNTSTNKVKRARNLGIDFLSILMVLGSLLEANLGSKTEKMASKSESKKNEI